MLEIVWLESAIDDVVRLRKFIAKENPEAAKRAAQAIKSATLHLKEFPEMGKPVKEPIHYRDLSVRFGAGGYILRYRMYLDIIYIVHVRHFKEASFKI
jgi:plasmid stabilization system protein ParE